MKLNQTWNGRIATFKNHEQHKTILRSTENKSILSENHGNFCQLYIDKCYSKQMGKQRKQWQTLSFGAPKSLQIVTAAMKLKDARSLEEKLWPTEIAYWKAYEISTLPTKVLLVKAMVFSVVMYGCESWTVKKAECQRIDAFELWHWRRLLRVPWTARRSNQFILKETILNIHWKDWCWSWNCNTLATW